jgi:hypothetical protein
MTDPDTQRILDETWTAPDPETARSTVTPKPFPPLPTHEELLERARLVGERRCPYCCHVEHDPGSCHGRAPGSPLILADCHCEIHYDDAHGHPGELCDPARARDIE